MVFDLGGNVRCTPRGLGVYIVYLKPCHFRRNVLFFTRRAHLEVPHCTTGAGS